MPRDVPGRGRDICTAYHDRNRERRRGTGKARARHDDQPVPQENPPYETVVRIRIDPDHQIVALLDHIDGADRLS